MSIAGGASWQLPGAEGCSIICDQDHRMSWQQESA